MKRVFTNSDDVIHLFAKQEQTDARCSNVFFDLDYQGRKQGFKTGNVIYSYGYHYELGRFLDKDTIMINDSGYSVTTSKHISQIRWGTRQYKQFFKSMTDVSLVHQSVMTNWKKFEVARKPENYASVINSLWDSLNEFLKWNRTLTKHKKGSSKEAKQYREIRKIVNRISEVMGSEDITAAMKVMRDKANARDDKRIKESLKKFRNYEIDSFRIGSEDYLRISAGGTHVETTQGVAVPIAEAATLYKLIKAGKDIKGHRIYGWTVIGINGVLRIGCHKINRANMTEIGDKILTLV